MSNTYNYAGHNIIVDSVTELKRRTTRTASYRNLAKTLQIAKGTRALCVRMYPHEAEGVVISAYAYDRTTDSESETATQCKVDTPIGVVAVDCKATDHNPSVITRAWGTGFIALVPNDDDSVYYPWFLRMDPKDEYMGWKEYGSAADAAEVSMDLIRRSWVIGTFSYDHEGYNRTVDVYEKAMSFWDAQVGNLMKVMSEAENASDEQLNTLARAMGVEKVFGRIAVLEALIDRLIVNMLSVGDATSKFRFRAMNRTSDTDETPVFDVVYDGRTIFKVEPDTGKIFLGEPSADGSEPISGFMFDPEDSSLKSAGNGVVIQSNGRMWMKDGYMELSTFSTAPKESGTQFSATIAEDAETAFNALNSAYGSLLRVNYKYRCSVVDGDGNDRGVAYISYVNGYNSGYRDYDQFTFFDEDLNAVGIVYRGVRLSTVGGGYQYVNTLGTGVATLIYGQPDVFKFIGLPKASESANLEAGQVYYDESTGALYIKRY